MTNCGCVQCEIDREKNRPQFLIVWPNGTFYNPTLHRFSASRAEARVFGPRHYFGPMVKRVPLESDPYAHHDR